MRNTQSIAAHAPGCLEDGPGETCDFCKYPAWIDAIRLATIPTETGKVSYWQQDEEIYRLNEYEPVQFDVYGVPLGARWECSSANWPTLLELLNGYSHSAE